MPNIVLTRIDNRLVHGQVATQWCGSIGANLILGLVFAGKGVREKSDKALRREHMRRSGIVLCVYVVLNVIRLYLGGQLF